MIPLDRVTRDKTIAFSFSRVAGGHSGKLTHNVGPTLINGMFNAQDCGMHGISASPTSVTLNAVMRMPGASGGAWVE